MMKEIKLAGFIFLILVAHVYYTYSQTVTDYQSQHIIRFQVPEVGISDALHKLVTIDRVEDGFATAYTTTADLPAFLSLGIPYTELPHPSQITEHCMRDVMTLPDSIWDFYPTYTSYLSLMSQFEANFPDLCRIEEIGTLVGGRKLLAAVISTNVDSIEMEPRFLYTSSMHGDELVGYVLTLQLIQYLLDEYGINPLVTHLLDNLEIWINPLANPNGTFYGGNHTVNNAIRFNANWVDFNRNFPDPEDGPHPDNKPWQQETLYFMALADSLKFNMSANIHGGAEVCNYPWDTWPQYPADNSWWVMVCNQYADSAQFYGPSGYFNDFGTGVVNGYTWYTISGGRQDYMNYFHLCREFTLEISQVKLPAASTLPTFWNANYRSLLHYMEQATYGLRGIVYDSLTNQAIPAMITISGHDMDSSHVRTRMPFGDYYRYLYPGLYDVTYSSPGYFSRTVTSIPVVPGQAVIRDVALLPLFAQAEIHQESMVDIVYHPEQHGLQVTGDGVLSSLELFDMQGRLVLTHPHTVALPVLLPLSGQHRPGVYVARFFITNRAAQRQPCAEKLHISN
ncbi:MAG TPA: M14 family zinc carboxypeptidase [Bacteroidales bacterium]|nr:M14 family zinc carboxypeptidase [Bacteroidales bacterium]